MNLFMGHMWCWIYAITIGIIVLIRTTKKSNVVCGFQSNTISNLYEHIVYNTQIFTLLNHQFSVFPRKIWIFHVQQTLLFESGQRLNDLPLFCHRYLFLDCLTTSTYGIYDFRIQTIEASCPYPVRDKQALQTSQKIFFRWKCLFIVLVRIRRKMKQTNHLIRPSTQHTSHYIHWIAISFDLFEALQMKMKLFYIYGHVWGAFKCSHVTTIDWMDIECCRLPTTGTSCK